MTRAVVLTLALCTAFAWAGGSFDEAPAVPCVVTTAAVPEGPDDEKLAQVGSSRPINPDEVDWSTVGPGGREIPEDEATVPLTPFIDWGHDMLIDELTVNPTFGKLSVDVAPNGDIYVAVLSRTAHPAGDTIYHYRSTDGGANWEQFSKLRNSIQGFRDMALRIGSDAGGVWIYTFHVHDGNRGLYVRRLRPDLSDFDWVQILGGDTIMRVTADRNVETPQHLFVAWETSVGNIRMRSSSDQAMTWGNHRNVTAGRQRPAIAAGGDGYVYLTYFDRTDSTDYRVVRYTNNLISPEFVFNTVDQNADHRIRDVSVAAARTAPGGSQTAVLLATREWVPNGNHAARYARTTNGGVTWTHGPWPPTNIIRETWRARGPYVRFSYHNPVNLFRGIVTMPEATTGFDSLVYAFARDTSPTNWEDRDVHNDHRATGEFAAQTDGSSQTAGAFIVYREYGSANIWFDGYNWTGVEEEQDPAPAADRLSLPFGRNEVRLGLDRPAPVRVVLFDGTGRELRVVHDGALTAGEHRLPVTTGGLARGVYFVSVDIAGARQTGKLVLTD